MPTVSIRDQIKKLVDLQALDVEIYNFKKELKEKPVLLEDLRNKYEFSKAELKAFEDKFKTVLVDRKGEELELQSKDEAIAKANMALSSLKTNREYSAKLLEIEGLKADKSQIEEKILLSFEESDTVAVSIEKEKKNVAEAEKIYQTQKQEIEDSIREIEEKIAVLDGKRKQIVPEVDKTNLTRYERILENKGGLAIVPVKSMSCGGCFMHIPQQVISDLKLHDRLVYCEMCARIIYLEDDL